MNKSLVGFKYLKLIYSLAFVLGFALTVYVHEKPTHLQNKAAQASYTWQCDFNWFSVNDCRGLPGLVSSQQTFQDSSIDVNQINNKCFNTVSPAIVAQKLKLVSTKQFNCKCLNCPAASPTLTTAPLTQQPIQMPSATPTRGPTNAPRPSATPTPVLGTKGCGITCGSTSECQSGFSCRDVNSGGNVCWNDGICGGPALKLRIEGIVRGCNNQPLPNVPVWAWGNVDYTDQTGKFQLNKGVTRNSEGDITLNETSVMAGFDATKSTTTGLGYFDSSAGRQFDALQLRSGNSCGLVNCIFTNREGDGLNIANSHKLLAGGPSRTAYRIGRRYSNPNQGFTDALFEYNFVFTDYHAGKFNFKQIGCPTIPSPTLTPLALLSCNALCTHDSECAVGYNNTRYCAMQWNPSAYIWSPADASDFNISGSGKLTGANYHVSPEGTKFQLHAIKGNQVYYRERPISQMDWLGIGFTSVTHNVNTVGCGTAIGQVNCALYKIIDFNSHIFRNNTGTEIIEQHLIRSNGTDTKIYYRSVLNRNWNTAWGGPATSLDNVGIVAGQNNTITSFNSLVTYDGYRLQTFVRGGRVYQRQIGLYSWINTMSNFDSCTANGKCGYNTNGTNPIVSYKVAKTANDKQVAFLIRADGHAYKLTATALRVSGTNAIMQKCKLKSRPWHPNCGIDPTQVP